MGIHAAETAGAEAGACSVWLEAGQVEVGSGNHGRPLLLRCEHVGTDPVRQGTGQWRGNGSALAFNRSPLGEDRLQPVKRWGSSPMRTARPRRPWKKWRLSQGDLLPAWKNGRGRKVLGMPPGTAPRAGAGVQREGCGFGEGEPRSRGPCRSELPAVTTGT